jgi:hypothetical protein
MTRLPRKRPRFVGRSVPAWLLILVGIRSVSKAAESFSLDSNVAAAAGTPTAADRCDGALSTASYWEHVEQGPPDAILGIAQSFRECVRPLLSPVACYK